MSEAGKSSLQSELIALQIFLLSGVATSSTSSMSLASLTTNSKVYCVLGINAPTASYLILQTNFS